IWTYAMWICILFGVEVAAIVQRHGGRRDELEEMERVRLKSGMVDSTSVLLLMEVVAEGFESGRAVSLGHLVEETGLPETVAAEILDALSQQGFVHRLATLEASFTLARPPEDITADSLLECGESMLYDRHGRRTSRAIEALRRAQRKLAADTTLAGLGRPADGRLTAG
ncbi:MAG: hypothetical protein ACR2IT_03455, partial [Pirellulales bacterium]